MDMQAHIEEVLADLKLALQEGWLCGDDMCDWCVFCNESADYQFESKSYTCYHDQGCLMTKYANLLKG